MINTSENHAIRYMTIRELGEMPQLRRLPSARREEMLTVAQVLPFRVNNYVVDELIDWARVPDDPMFQLTFPQPEMLSAEQRALLRATAGDRRELRRAVTEIRGELNPHPSGPAHAQRAACGRSAGARRAAQVRRDVPGVPVLRAELPRVLHVLLPLGAVRRATGI